MPIVVADLSDEKLEILVENHRRNGVTEGPLYVEAIRELARRSAPKLTFNKCFAAIRNAAEQRRFLSFKELAEANGVEWNYGVRKTVLKHLWWLAMKPIAGDGRF